MAPVTKMLMELILGKIDLANTGHEEISGCVVAGRDRKSFQFVNEVPKSETGRLISGTLSDFNALADARSG